MESLNKISINRFWNRYGVHTLWAVAIFCLLAALSKVAWTVYTQSKIKQANYQPQEVVASTPSSRQAYRVNDIVSANLFGDPSPKAVVKETPKTTLDLTLQGILWASDASMARAIIMTGKTGSELYSVGESIKGAGASVKEIRNNEVLLNRNGATESLPLLKKTISGDRQLLSFSDEQTQLRQVPNRQGNQAARNIQQAGSKMQAPNGAPRKIRKPNFSGLDRALKKMGEL